MPLFCELRSWYNFGMDNDILLDDLALERAAKEKFGLALEVGKVIARQIDCGQAARATFFLSGKKQLYCYIEGSPGFSLGDIKKMLTRMNVRPETFFPPKGYPNYFDDVARRKFLKVYPGRRDIQAEDLRFYRTLAPYCPALVSIGEVKNGVIFCADHDARTGWRPAVKFAYRRIRTS